MFNSHSWNITQILHLSSFDLMSYKPEHNSISEVAFFFFIVQTLITLMIFQYWPDLFICRDANIISTQEAEELLVIIISFFLDRQLVGLSIIFLESLLSVINFFKDEEWPDCCEKVANSLACRFYPKLPLLYIIKSCLFYLDLSLVVAYMIYYCCIPSFKTSRWNIQFGWSDNSWFLKC